MIAGGNLTFISGENEMKKIDVIAAILVVVGALNWGMVGIPNYIQIARIQCR